MPCKSRRCRNGRSRSIREDRERIAGSSDGCRPLRGGIPLVPNRAPRSPTFHNRALARPSPRPRLLLGLRLYYVEKAWVESRGIWRTRRFGARRRAYVGGEVFSCRSFFTRRAFALGCMVKQGKTDDVDVSQRALFAPTPWQRGASPWDTCRGIRLALGEVGAEGGRRERGVLAARSDLSRSIGGADRAAGGAGRRPQVRTSP